jgi:hypothetical protein
VVEAELVGEVIEQVVPPVVFDRGRLGRAGRAGREDGVADVLAADQDRRACRRQAVERAAQRGEVHNLLSAAGHHGLGTGRGDDQRQRGQLRCHQEKPLHRVRGVQRHITGPGLQRAEDGDQQLGAAVQTDADEITLADLPAEQVVRELVGPCVEFCVGTGPFAAGHGDPLRSGCGVHFESSMHERIGRQRFRMAT